VASNLRSFEAHFTKFGDISSFRGRWSPHVESPAAYLDKKAQRTDSIYTVDWGIRFQLMALLSAQPRAKGEGFLADLSRLVT
jgi:hypothetical protein